MADNEKSDVSPETEHVFEEESKNEQLKQVDENVIPFDDVKAVTDDLFSLEIKPKPSMKFLGFLPPSMGIRLFGMTR